MKNLGNNFKNKPKKYLTALLAVVASVEVAFALAASPALSFAFTSSVAPSAIVSLVAVIASVATSVASSFLARGSSLALSAPQCSSSPNAGSMDSLQ